MSTNKTKKVTLICGKCNGEDGFMMRVPGGWSWTCNTCGWVGFIKT